MMTNPTGSGAGRSYTASADLCVLVDINVEKPRGRHSSGIAWCSYEPTFISHCYIFLEGGENIVEKKRDNSIFLFHKLCPCPIRILNELCQCSWPNECFTLRANFSQKVFQEMRTISDVHR